MCFYIYIFIDEIENIYMCLDKFISIIDLFLARSLKFILWA